MKKTIPVDTYLNNLYCTPSEIRDWSNITSDDKRYISRLYHFGILDKRVSICFRSGHYTLECCNFCPSWFKGAYPRDTWFVAYKSITYFDVSYYFALSVFECLTSKYALLKKMELQARHVDLEHVISDLQTLLEVQNNGL